MPQIAIAVPILPGKLDQFRKSVDDMNGPEFTGFLNRNGLNSVNVFHQHNPDGSDLAIVVHEGPDPQKWFTQGMSSNEPIAQQWREMAAEVHGMGPDKPMPEFSHLGTVGK